jgi:N-methylhydantoinase A/oxoprolinase/acetone carboxylase beta subunit
VTGEILLGENLKALNRIVFSTTISANAIVQGKINRVGLAIACGPGLPSSLLKISDDPHFVSGYINQRGAEVAPINAGEISKIGERFKKEGIHHLGVVGKFSTRNPKQEI